MDQTQNKENKKKKNRFLPFIWLFGSGLAGGVIVMALLLGKKNNQLEGLENQLSNTTATLNQEKNTLQSELQKVSTDYAELQSTNESLNTVLKEQKFKNSSLSRQYGNLMEREKESHNDYDALMGSFNNLRNENDLLKGNLASEQSETDNLRKQLMNYDDMLTAQKKVVSEQNEKYKTDSAVSVEIIDSFINETKLKFCNITELNAAYGLYVRQIPYSHYFYGINNVSGFKINKHFISGIGIGLSSYNEGLAMPLYLDFRYQFNKRKFTPYLWFDSGLILKFDDIKEPMLFINPGIGLYKSISDHFAISMGAGVFVQRDILTKSTFANFKLGLIYIKGINKRKIIR